jgi:hypothetical protein
MGLRACLKSRMRGQVIVGVMTISTDAGEELPGRATPYFFRKTCPKLVPPEFFVPIGRLRVL